ncbi:MAG: AhpD family alkylhydroperoxidase [Arenicella sp.]|jgi:AhpD family alkylhydroperoxidase
MSLVKEFNDNRSRLNEVVNASSDKVLKRILSLDSLAFREGALDLKSKELIGLTTSLVLRCDDCVYYHLGRCQEVGLSKEQIIEAMGISNLIGGTIVIPHLRKAIEFLNELFGEE